MCLSPAPASSRSLLCLYWLLGQPEDRYCCLEFIFWHLFFFSFFLSLYEDLSVKIQVLELSCRVLPRAKGSLFLVSSKYVTGGL